MKGQSILDYIISISIYLSTLVSVIFFTISSLNGAAEHYLSNLGLVRTIAVSQQLIYYNGSSRLNETLGLSTGRYNEVNFTKLVDFFNNCRRNPIIVKNIFLSNDFFIKVDNLECLTRRDIQTIKRLLVINRSIRTLEIGIRL